MVKLEIMMYFDANNVTREYVVTKGETLSVKPMIRKPKEEQIGEGLYKNILFTMTVSDFSNNEMTLTVE